MKDLLESIKVWIMVKLFWRSKGHLGESLRVFSATEADSAWQIQQVMPHVQDLPTRAELFGQVLEEMHHAELFYSQWQRLSGALYIPEQRERQSLYRSGEETWKFFAYCIVGEKAALDRFSHIAKALPSSNLRDVFKKILRDEAGHVHSAQGFADEAQIDITVLKRELKKIRRLRFREAWMRQGKMLTDKLASAFLLGIYFLVGPFGKWATAKRFRNWQPLPTDTEARPQPSTTLSLKREMS
jgi:rubrerythrin